MSAIDRLGSALVGRYSIERELGTGGMATVYLARDLKHDRQVALKVLHPQLAAVVGAERFLKEIKTTAHLQHPHILPLFDSGEADGLLFYVMPYVDGESLRDRLTREKRLAVADALRITSDVASALDYAHRHGVIHRDIKPENILLHDGRALVADFGIALAPNAGDSRLTETGVSIGTPEYMSPEQALGEQQLDARADIYAVGVMLYEMLIGSPPFTGPSAQAIVAKVITEKPVPPSRLRKEIPAHVEDATLTALSKNPADRFATAAALRSAIEGTSAVPRQPGSPTRRAWWAVGTVGLLVGLGALAVRPWQGSHAVRVRAPADTAATRLAAEAADWAKRRDGPSCQTAIRLYSEATDRDSTYAGAWAGLAKTHALCALFAPGDPTVAFAAAKSTSEIALRLDSTVSDGYTARGMVHLFHEQNFRAAQDAFKEASMRDSSRFEPWLFRSWAYIGAGNLDSAVISMRRAKALQPVGDPITGVRLATVLRFEGHIEEARRAVAEELARDSTNRLAREEQFQIDVETKQCETARSDLRLLKAVVPQPIQWAHIAYHWASCGDPNRARRSADSVAAQAATGAYVDYLALGIVYAGLGDSGKMFQALSKAVSQHNPLLFFLGHHFAFEPYRRTAQFVELMKRAHVK